MNRRFSAAVLRGHGLRMAFECVAAGELRATEVLVRIVACGVCHTDLKVAKVDGLSPRPIVLGHEGAGIVEKVGSAVRQLSPGHHVVLTFDSCGACKACQAGRPSYCYSAGPMCFGGLRLDGSRTLATCSDEPVHGSYFGQSSFATFAIASERNAIKVPADLSLSTLAPLGCGFQTGAGAVLNTFRLTPGQTIAIFGVGAVGLAAVMAARIAGAGDIIAVDQAPDRLALALELGAHAAIDGRDGNVLEAIRQRTGRGVDFSLDTTAVDTVIAQAIESTDTFGICGLLANKGPQQAVSVNILAAMLRGRSVRGIVQGDSEPHSFIPRLVEFHRSGLFPIEKLIRLYPFGEIETALADAESGHTIKPVLVWKDAQPS